MRMTSGLIGTARFLSLAILLSCLLTVTALGQTTTGSLTGSATDPKGAIVAGARVTLVNPQTGGERNVVSNSDGVFDFQALQPGTYSLTVEAAGFRKAV